MVRIELLELTEEKATYRYFPENETSRHGVVSVDRKTFARSIDRLLDGYGSAYAFHACREIDRYIRSNNFKRTGLVAWY